MGSKTLFSFLFCLQIFSKRFTSSGTFYCTRRTNSLMIFSLHQCPTDSAISLGRRSTGDDETPQKNPSNSGMCRHVCVYAVCDAAQITNGQISHEVSS